MISYSTTGTAGGRTRTLHTLQFSLASWKPSNTNHPCSHLFISSKQHLLSWLMPVALFSILLKFSSLLPFLFLACAPPPDLLPLAAICEPCPHPLYQGFAFSDVASNQRCSAPHMISSMHGWRFGLWDRTNLSYSQAYPNCVPRI